MKILLKILKESIFRGKKAKVLQKKSNVHWQKLDQIVPKLQSGPVGRKEVAQATPAG